MRAAASLLVAGLFCAGAVQGQQQSVTLQMQCRNLSGTGNYMAADGAYVNEWPAAPFRRVRPALRALRNR